MITLETMLEVFRDRMNINQTTGDGESLLHLVSKEGEYEYISTLVNYGIDLAIQDDIGNTFLHDLAEQAGHDPENSEVSLQNHCRYNKLTCNTVADASFEVVIVMILCYFQVR